MGGEDVAFPFSVLEQERVVNYEAGGEGVVVFFKQGALSAFGQSGGDGPRDVGATGVFESTIGERKLTFRADGAAFVDNETGTVWNILGQATSGPLEGEKLTPVVHANHFWFAWGGLQARHSYLPGRGLAQSARLPRRPTPRARTAPQR